MLTVAVRPPTVFGIQVAGNVPASLIRRCGAVHLSTLRLLRYHLTGRRLGSTADAVCSPANLIRTATAVASLRLVVGFGVSPNLLDGHRSISVGVFVVDADESFGQGDSLIHNGEQRQHSLRVDPHVAAFDPHTLTRPVLPCRSDRIYLADCLVCTQPSHDASPKNR
jgi:hypothetical protein